MSERSSIHLFRPKVAPKSAVSTNDFVEGFTEPFVKVAGFEAAFEDPSLKAAWLKGHYIGGS